MSSSIAFAVLLGLLTIISISYLHSLSKGNSFRLNHARPSLKRARVLCLILTAPNNLLTRARAINSTWGPRCDGYFFICELSLYHLKYDVLQFAKQLPIAPIKNIEPGYVHLTQKTTLAFLFAFEHYANEFDWFVKADDDTYILVDQLRDFLSTQNTSAPVTFGYNFKVIIEMRLSSVDCMSIIAFLFQLFVPKGYHSGGASYALSRESLRRFSQGHLSGNAFCVRDGGNEDVEIARCLRNLGVSPGRSLDEHDRELFHPLPFSHHFRGLFPDWLPAIAENPVRKVSDLFDSAFLDDVIFQGYDCCGEGSISFHYVPVEEQYLMDFLYLS